MPQLDEHELRLALQRLARRIRNNRSDASLGDSHMGVLSYLSHIESASPSEVAEHERVSAPSINRTLNALEQEGLVSRAPAPGDARRVAVSITEAGLTLVNETRELRTAWFALRLSELTPAERDVLASATPILARIATH